MKAPKESLLLTYHSEQGLGEWLKDFSKHLSIEVKNSKIEYPDNFGTGFAKVNHIEPGLGYRIVDYNLNTNFKFSKEPSESIAFEIYFYQYSNIEKLSISINNETIIDTSEKNLSGVLMTKNSGCLALNLSKGVSVKGLTIELTEEWLKGKLEKSDYQMINAKSPFADYLTAKSKKLLHEIFTGYAKSSVPGLFINTRVLRLLEDFLQKILSKNILEYSFPSSADFQSILKIESILAESYCTGFPSIEKLAPLALMSESKLKRVFNKAFGMGLYEYYQKNRMHKAKELLMSNKYSVAEVGSIIGFINMSNFSNAFKKEFGHLPKDFDKIG